MSGTLEIWSEFFYKTVPVKNSNRRLIMGKNTIDFVIPWVDGNDPEWRRRKAEKLREEQEAIQLYRDWGLLRYWFRAVEKFTPWVRRIWFICDQQPPSWLNIRHPKLKIIRHEDYIPAEYLPVFSSHPIELNLHRIKGLSEQFVYFNDDTFLLRPVKPDFFFRNGLPRDSAILNPIPTAELAENESGSKIFTIYLYNTEYLNRDYDFHTCLRKHPTKWLNLCYGKDLIRNIVLMAWPRFVGFSEDHLPNAFLKSSFEKAWIRDFDVLDMTSRHPIRRANDVNQWLIRMRQLAEGDFIPRAPQKNCTFLVSDESSSMHNMIRKQKKPMICINDSGVLNNESFQKLQRELIADFDSILESPSSYEK